MAKNDSAVSWALQMFPGVCCYSEEKEDLQNICEMVLLGKVIFKQNICMLLGCLWKEP